MNKNQHTPGPWYVLGEYISSKSGGEIVCPIKRIRDADLPLIAAAPDLLDVARKALRELRSINPGPAGDREGNRALLIAAIAKAEGGAA
jgi:hypothetical protein